MQGPDDTAEAGFESELWHDARELPEALAATLQAADGFAEVAELLAHRSVRRVVVTGNGASYYVGLNLWLTSLRGSGAHPEADLISIPAGLIATGDFEWRDGDVLLAISSSGEFRDVVEAVLNDSKPRPCAAITASPDSTLGSNVTARALVSLVSQRAVTHTQAFCGAVVASLAVWARLTGDDELEHSLQAAVDDCANSLVAAESWAAERLSGVATPSAGVAFGSGPALSAAMETALLMKEVARVPWEGAETREGATSAMYSLGPGRLVFAIGLAGDPLLREAEQTCSRSGAEVVRILTRSDDARLAAITSFPAALAASIVFGCREGLDVDRPGWVDGYFSTARSSEASAQ